MDQKHFRSCGAPIKTEKKKKELEELYYFISFFGQKLFIYCMEFRI